MEEKKLEVRVPHECRANKSIKAFVSRGGNAKLYNLGLFPLRCPHCGNMMKPNIAAEYQHDIAQEHHGRRPNA